MRENIEKKIETFVYGLLTFAFAAAFFFGVLYPSHGLSPNAFHRREPECQEIVIPEQDTKGTVRVTFLFYERLKNS
ncbi:MAG: hypothetical protein J6B19_01650 [Lachnospiraceae bacterium]|nr:hypothetical protein [Lachnospiraceae bacterium]